WSENTCAARLIRLIQQYHGIVIKTDIRTVFPAQLIFCANNDCLGNSSFFDTTCRQCVLHCNYYLVTNPGCCLATISENTNTQYFFCSTVISYIQSAFLLNHFFSF